jgi:hypothetical protein
MKPLKTILAIFIFAFLFADSTQYLYNFRLPYCSEVIGDIDIIRNPLRIYLRIFRSLFCLVDDPKDAKNSRRSFLSEDVALSIANQKISQLLNPSSSGSGTATTATSTSKKIKVTIKGQAVKLATDSFKSLRDSLDMSVRKFLTNRKITT